MWGKLPLMMLQWRDCEDHQSYINGNIVPIVQVFEKDDQVDSDERGSSDNPETEVIYVEGVSYRNAHYCMWGVALSTFTEVIFIKRRWDIAAFSFFSALYERILTFCFCCKKD